MTGFSVSVGVSPGSLASLLPMSSIKTDVELKLRIAHLPVLATEQSLRDINAGTILVTVNGVHHSSLPLWAISLRAECTQFALLMRDRSIPALGVTWVEGNVFLVGEGAVPQLRENIKDWIDEFVNLYLTANP